MTDQATVSCPTCGAPLKTLDAECDYCGRATTTDREEVRRQFVELLKAADKELENNFPRLGCLYMSLIPIVPVLVLMGLRAVGMGWLGTAGWTLVAAIGITVIVIIVAVYHDQDRFDRHIKVRIRRFQQLHSLETSELLVIAGETLSEESKLLSCLRGMKEDANV